MLDIILRTCSRKEAQVHGTERLHPKEEILKRCFKSLKNSIDYSFNKNRIPIKLTIVDDHSDKTIVDILKQNCDFFISLIKTGNSASLHTIYDLAAENCGNLIYFVEDDYLHEKEAIYEMLDFYNTALERGIPDIGVFPLDAVERYVPPGMRPSIIFPGKYRYWRQTDSTTGTMMISKKMFIQHFDLFKQFANYSFDSTITEENTINRIWQEHRNWLVSPIPSLTYHLQLSLHLPLYTNYELLWHSLANSD